MSIVKPAKRNLFSSTRYIKTSLDKKRGNQLPLDHSCQEILFKIINKSSVLPWLINIPLSGLLDLHGFIFLYGSCHGFLTSESWVTLIYLLCFLAYSWPNRPYGPLHDLTNHLAFLLNLTLMVVSVDSSFLLIKRQKLPTRVGFVI